MSDEPEDAPVPQEQVGDDGTSRRGFLAAAVGACAGASVLGVVSAAWIGTPLSGEAGAAGWFDLGALNQFPVGTVIKVSVKGEQRDAWNRFTRSVGRVVVVRQGEEDLKVFSAVCPHNGCDVFVAERQLVCPCHDSLFGLNGARKGGKSPRDLDALEHAVEDERLRVRYQRFEVGIAEQKPVS